MRGPGRLGAETSRCQTEGGWQQKRWAAAAAAAAAVDVDVGEGDVVGVMSVAVTVWRSGTVAQPGFARKGNLTEVW